MAQKFCIAIYGNHGVGKTGLAKLICNRVYYDYSLDAECVSFSTALLKSFVELTDYGADFIIDWERSREFKEKNRHIVNEFGKHRYQLSANDTVKYIRNSKSTYFIIDDYDPTKEALVDSLQMLFDHRLLTLNVIHGTDFNMDLTEAFVERSMNIMTRFPHREICYPILDVHSWSFYKKSKSASWMAEELDFSKDLIQIQTVPDPIIKYLKHLLAFFAVSDFFVNSNIGDNLMENKYLSMEASFYYNEQMNIENVHSESYARMVNVFMPNDVESQVSLISVRKSDSLAAKAFWMKELSNKKKSYPLQLFASAIMEGLFFCSSFAGINWLRSMNIFPGLTQANSLIARDENLHYSYAMTRYALNIPARKEVMREILNKSFSIEVDFIMESIPVEGIDAIPDPLVPIGTNRMTRDAMIQYARFVFNRIARDFNIMNDDDEIVENPFPFQDDAALITKNNFFERHGVEYRKAFVGETKTGYNDSNIYSLDGL